MVTDSALPVAELADARRHLAFLRVVGLTGIVVATVALRDVSVREFGLFTDPHRWSTDGTTAGFLVWQLAMLTASVLAGIVATERLAGSWAAAGREMTAIVCAALAVSGAIALQTHPANRGAELVWFVLFFGMGVRLLGRGTYLLQVSRRGSLWGDAALALVVGAGLGLGAELVASSWLGGLGALTWPATREVVGIGAVLLVVAFVFIRPASIAPRDVALLVGVGGAGTALWQTVGLSLGGLLTEGNRPLHVQPLPFLVAGLAVAVWSASRQHLETDQDTKHRPA